MDDLIINLVLLGAFIAILVKSAIFAINSIVRFSKITGIGELAAGFVIVAVSTSAPEISVAVFSTHSNNIGITLGDIFGSNVTNIALISALFLLASPIKQIEKKTVKSMLPLLLASSAIPLTLLLAQEGSKFVGIVLLAVFGLFIYHTIKSNPKNAQARETGSAARSLVLFCVGIALVIISAKVIVDSASSIAAATGIRQSVIGATIVAFGTSLPELTVDIIAVRKRHLDLALGDIVGSCITNITLVLGIVLVLSDISVNFGILSSLIGFSIVAPLALFLLLRTSKIRILHSALLFGIFAVFLMVLYEIQLQIGGLRLF
ncbi:sodium:calcium antiporter [Candidatus Nitrosotenuis uzonensis]|uniref:Putative Na+/Ca+ antiporter, CaCA family n=1 Tax=Candidatus Nitrosotenuis uzonensis TaxID=1407055 RepID=A0A812EY85_9ARCH|nr:sodium:calcium antiporter [Candidatus Nitrosotenuis uzonensis]MCA2003228.1 sodium:calcium antiporter [Candidatus Nitrosotenuis sp.]CAE6487784.1 putative Na+/Ca+ antiporter, CaCA family [Candidatus Nitrosotenuis uzonensis]